MGAIEDDLTQKNFTLVVALKKKSRLFTIFPDFFQVWKIAGKFQDFFKNSKLCTNPACSTLVINLSNNKTA